MARAKFERTNPALSAASIGAAAAETDTKTGAADAAQPGEMLPAMGAAGATADAAGADTSAADAGDVWPTPTPPTVIVKGPAKGRWRIGRQFGAEPVSIPVTELTEEQYRALIGDPELLVTIVDAPY